MRGRPGCFLQSTGGEANRILLASALSSIRIMCPNSVSRRDRSIQSRVCPFLISPSSPNHTGILVRCTCCTAWFCVCSKFATLQWNQTSPLMCHTAVRLRLVVWCDWLGFRNDVHTVATHPVKVSEFESGQEKLWEDVCLPVVCYYK